MFEQASRLKAEFNYKGTCSVESLWDLSVANLKKIYVGLKAELKALVGDTMLDDDFLRENVTEKDSKEIELLELKLNIVKHIATVLAKEKKMRLDEKAKSLKKQEILGIIQEREHDELKDKSVEDLKEIYNQI